MAAGTKPRRQAKVDAAEIRATAQADAARRLECAEAERRAILTDANHRASLVLREAERKAAAEAVRLRNEALHDAARIRDEAVEEIVKLMATLTTERDHILADARDDARRIVDAAGQDGVSTSTEFEPRVDVAPSEQSPEGCAEPDPQASVSELDEILFTGMPAPQSDSPPHAMQRRRKGFRRWH